ncbi:MAG TPA: hypothetical protein VKR55_02270 [Bradyrhizobium sp.]|uniref:hypothetical protein n=1 Tax=Bradyrhizobium sp. TaxID=376 RepID=UPI002D088135|nr:hypothetical protein [Bradyrhizobium sp.]HLZ00959.1 hypothetical protein [Bradyrhizobium sp.]
MAKIKILGKVLTNEEVKQATELAVQAGCVADDVEIVESVGDPTADCEEDVLIVVITPAACGDPGLEGELEKLQNGGRRAVCVWPRGTEGAELPQAAQKYAYSIVPWEPKKLAAVLADDDVTCFETQAGEALPKVPMEHNLCVDDPKNTK